MDLSTARIKILLVLMTAALQSCSVKENYETLSFFFDGVPDPDAKTEVIKTDSSAVENDKVKNEKKRSPDSERVYHPVYLNNGCKNCHNREEGNSIPRERDELCYYCHADFRKEHEVLHGPVQAGYCVSCHNPHYSKNEFVLRTSQEKICFDCHPAERISKNQEHPDPEGMFCTDCHDPHGGDDSALLK